MTMKSILAAALLALAAAGAASAQSVSGLWDAQVTAAGAVVPFKLSIAQTKAGVRGAFFDGDRPENPSTTGAFDHGQLKLSFDSYATRLVAQLDHGVLRGA